MSRTLKKLEINTEGYSWTGNPVIEYKMTTYTDPGQYTAGEPFEEDNEYPAVGMGFENDGTPSFYVEDHDDAGWASNKYFYAGKMTFDGQTYDKWYQYCHRQRYPWVGPDKEYYEDSLYLALTPECIGTTVKTPVQVESAICDGTGKNIKDTYQDESDINAFGWSGDWEDLTNDTVYYENKLTITGRDASSKSITITVYFVDYWDWQHDPQIQSIHIDNVFPLICGKEAEIIYDGDTSDVYLGTINSSDADLVYDTIYVTLYSEEGNDVPCTASSLSFTSYQRSVS